MPQNFQNMGFLHADQNSLDWFVYRLMGVTKTFFWKWECAIWQYQLWSFELGNSKLERLLETVKRFKGKFYIPYSREQKHVLLFRKSDFWFLVSNSNMPQFFFFRNKTFLFVVRMSWKKRYLTNAWCVCQVSFFSAHSDNFYFLTPHVTNWI